MGSVNILKSGYTGKVGATYGVEKDNKYIAKAVPFSHTPHNATQKNCKSAFTKLNRLSADIAKKMWSYLGLSDKKMYRNNAVAQWLKPLVKDHVFELSNLDEVFGQDESLLFSDLDYIQGETGFSITINNNSEVSAHENEHIYYATVTNEGFCKRSGVFQGSSFLFKSFFDLLDFAYFRFLTFKAVLVGKHWKVKAYSLSPILFLIIIDGVFFILRWRWTKAPYIIDGVLYLPKEASYIENGIFYLR